jgi:hypothetical protein
MQGGSVDTIIKIFLNITTSFVENFYVTVPEQLQILDRLIAISIFFRFPVDAQGMHHDLWNKQLLIMKKALLSLLSLSYCLLFLSPQLQAAKKKKLDMGEPDRTGNYLSTCEQSIAFCLQFDQVDTLELTLTTQNGNNPYPKVSLIHANTDQLVWQSSPSDIKFLEQAGEKSFTYDVVIDLTGITSPQGRASLQVIGFDLGQNPKQLAFNYPAANQADFSFVSAAVCLREYCTQFDNCPCEGGGGGGFGFGFLAGHQTPSFDPEGLTADKFAFNPTNKFVGIQMTAGKKAFYYQGELSLSQLNFSQLTVRQPTPGGPPDSLSTSYSVVRTQLVPLQFRLRLGKLGSIGAGAGLSYLLSTREDGQEATLYDGPLDRIEPELFLDLRIGNSRKGLQGGYRLATHWSGLDDLTGDRYRLGKLYLVYSF